MRKTFFLAVIALLTLASCKKENKEPVNHELKVKTATGSSGTTSYKYDDQGRRIQLVHPNGARIDYIYQGNIVYEKYFNTAGIQTDIYTQELNSDGLAIKETISSKPGYIRTRLFNSDKQMLKWSENNNGNIIEADFFYKDGNSDSIRFKLNGNWTYTEKSTYYTDKVNVLNSDAFGTSHYGKRNKNLEKTTQNIFANGSNSSISTATYEFDTKGRVVKASYLFNGNTDNLFYTY